jgi:hypothetical protein
VPTITAVIGARLVKIELEVLAIVPKKLSGNEMMGIIVGTIPKNRANYMIVIRFLL